MKYQTKHKKEVLNLIKTFGGKHFNVDDLYKKSSLNNLSIGLTTLYRILNELVEENVLKKYFLDGNHNACFKLSDCIENSHIHFICSKCNKLYHIESNKLMDSLKVVEKENKILIDINKSILYGVCDECK